MHQPHLKVKAVLFDLDGTLLDTAPDLVSACNHTLEHFGFKAVADEIVRTKVTSGMREMLKLGVPKEQWQIADIEGAMREYFAQYYIDHICDYTQPFADIEALIEDLHQADIKMAVITNKYQNMARKLLAKFAFSQHLEMILGCDSLTNSKPHPEPILKALEGLQIAPFEAIYVGDHINDIQAANRAKTFSAAALWGYGKNECGDPNYWYAKFRLNTVKDLHNLIL